MYREALGHIVRSDRPDDDVRLADPQALDREASSFRPHLIVSTDNAPEVRGVSVLSSWVVIRYHDSLSASVFVDGQDPRLVQDISIEDLLGVVEETQRLVVRGSSWRVRSSPMGGLVLPLGVFFFLLLGGEVADGDPLLK